MVMKRQEIIDALGRLEMKGGMHVIPEELREAILAELKPHAPAKPAAPRVKGKPPE